MAKEVPTVGVGERCNNCVTMLSVSLVKVKYFHLQKKCRMKGHVHCTCSVRE